MAETPTPNLTPSVYALVEYAANSLIVLMSGSREKCLELGLGMVERALPEDASEAVREDALQYFRTDLTYVEYDLETRDSEGLSPDSYRLQVLEIPLPPVQVLVVTDNGVIPEIRVDTPLEAEVCFLELDDIDDPAYPNCELAATARTPGGIATAYPWVIF